MISRRQLLKGTAALSLLGLVGSADASNPVTLTPVGGVSRAPICIYGPKLMVTPLIDESCQANIVYETIFRDHKLPIVRQYGVWFDDTTPHLDSYVQLALHKYAHTDQVIFVCVPPGEPNLHHQPSPPIVNLYEWYPIGEGSPQSAWGKPPKYPGYIVQWDFTGELGTSKLTLEERRHLLNQVIVHRPKYIFYF